MPSLGLPQKTTPVYGLLAKLESSYGAATTTSTSTDGILLHEPFDFSRATIFNGERGGSNGNIGPWRPVPPGGFSGTGTPKIEMKGAGVAYSTSVLPPDIHVFMRASGHSATINTTASSESVTYAPEASNYASVYCEMYGRGEKWPVGRGQCDFSFSVDAGGIGIAEFPLSGVPTADPVDASVPSITYLYPTVNPPKMEGIAFSLTPAGASAVTTLFIRSISFAKNRAAGARADGNTTSGHQGFNLHRFNPELTVVMEQPAIATWNPWDSFKSAKANAITFTVGSTQYNRFVFTAGQAYLKGDPERAEDAEGVATITCKFRLASSTPIALDHYSVAWT